MGEEGAPEASHCCLIQIRVLFVRQIDPVHHSQKLTWIKCDKTGGGWIFQLRISVDFHAACVLPSACVVIPTAGNSSGCRIASSFGGSVAARLSFAALSLAKGSPSIYFTPFLVRVCSCCTHLALRGFSVAWTWMAQKSFVMERTMSWMRPSTALF